MVTNAKEIILIAPYDDLYATASNLVVSKGYHQVEVVKGDLDEGMRIATEKIDQGAKVIISRGGTFSLIQNAVNVPVVELRISVYDLMASYPQLMKLDEPIACIGYKNIISGFDLVSDLGKNVKTIEITHESDVGTLISECVREGITVFAGGAIVGRICESRGLRCYIWASSEYAITAAMDEALRILNASKREIELVNRYLTLTDYVHDGFIATNEENQVILMNVPAQKILEVNKADVVGRSIESLYPYGKVMEEIGLGRQLIDEIRTLNNKSVTISTIPILVNHEQRGSVTVFQEIAKLQNREQKVRIKLVEKGFTAKHSFNSIFYKSKKIEHCIAIAKKFSLYDCPVLIEGSTGVGKELFSQSIHNYSHRKHLPFVAVNCAALSHSLLESELFGYEEGAFTGSRKGGKAGVFEMAHRGTLFLDEISELPVDMQGRLLRVIQEREVVRLGGDKVIPLDVRLVCATNKDLRQLVEEGLFRRDLLFRINTLRFRVPPLNERPADISVLAQKFLERYNLQYAKDIKGFTSEALDFLVHYHYAGNVRELRGIVERSVILCEGRLIGRSDVLFDFDEDPEPPVVLEKPEAIESIAASGMSLRNLEQWYVQQIFEQTGNSQEQTCKILGISRTTLWKKLKESVDMFNI